jgi:hypothetical protein
MTVNALLRMTFLQLQRCISAPEVFWPTFITAGLMTAAWWLTIRRSDFSQARRALELAAVLGGVIALLWFFRFGRVDWAQNQDWQKEYTYGAALKAAVSTHTIPYYLWDPLQRTDRYLADLETIAAPHALLLAVLDVRQFIQLNILATFLVGAYALVRLGREVPLSPFTWIVFSTIFLFNGHIANHFGAGHLQWAAYFLLPWIYLCVVRASRGDETPGNATALALTLSAMIFIGGWHVFVWSWLYLLFFCVVSRRRLIFLGRASLIVAGLSAFRLLPAFATFGSGTNEFLGSYHHVSVLAAALVGDQYSTIDNLSWWEYDLYVGFTGLLLLVLGALPRKGPANRLGRDLLLPNAALLALSMYDLYAYTFFRLPGFVSERVATRLAVMTMLGLALAGCARLDKATLWRAGRVTAASVIVLLAGWLLALQLIVRTEVVRPLETRSAPPAVSTLRIKPVEAAYFRSVWAGAAISLVTLFVLADSFRRSGRSVGEPSQDVLT